jgi:hypothetical protein
MKRFENQIRGDMVTIDAKKVRAMTDWLLNPNDQLARARVLELEERMKALRSELAASVNRAE